MQSTIGIVAGDSEAGILLHPVRKQVLEQFREPASAAEVARRLEIPRQRVGHHVRLLQEHGLLQQVGERRKGNFVEQLLQANARAYLIAPQALGALGADRASVRDRFSSDYLVAAAAGIVRDLATLRRLADEAGKRVPTLTLETEVRFSGPKQQAAFAEELATALAELTAKYHDEEAENGRRFRFTIGGHPAVHENTETEGDDDEAVH